MKKLFTKVNSFYNILTGSIAFYPTFYSILAIFLAFFMKYIETVDASKQLIEWFPGLEITDVDTARNLLTTLIAGGISMLVFTFNMVMLLLSQAAANYSPRVLPSLISNRKHQLILGAFLGSILYNIITLIGIDEPTQNQTIPILSVLLGLTAAIISLAAFVFFIHNISSNIQINNILKNVFSKALKRLNKVIDSNYKDGSFSNTDDWITFKAKNSGTLQNISISGLKKIAKEQDIKIKLLQIKGTYLLANSPLFKINKEIDEKVTDEIQEYFLFREPELVSDNYVLGFKQITEIAVKAMSPGINDPGTAINAINYLTQLFCVRMNKPDLELLIEDDKELIELKTVSFEELIYTTCAALRTYSRNDVIVSLKMMSMYEQLLQNPASKEDYYKSIHKQAELLMHDCKEHIENTGDLEKLQNLYEKIAS